VTGSEQRIYKVVLHLNPVCCPFSRKSKRRKSRNDPGRERVRLYRDMRGSDQTYTLLYGVELTKGSVRQRGCSRGAWTAQSLLRHGRFYPATIKKASLAQRVKV
jgi:hypothetical protein